MRIVIVHNRYREPGGEDAVVAAEAALLRDHGHVVERYERDNDEIEAMSALALARDTLWSARTTRDLEQLLTTFAPDVVHVHNTLPLVSPAVHWPVAAAGVGVVQTLHNFRLLCPQAMLLRDGAVCEACVGRVPWRAVAYRCYRASATQSAVVGATVQLHRALGTWRHKVHRYIALNEFCRAKFIEGGLLPAARIAVKPNFVDWPDAPAEAPRRGVLYVGRLAAEKGIDVLADAAAQLAPDTTIDVIGTGPEAPRLEGRANVRLLGAQPPSEVARRMATAAVLVLPSICYESHPRTLVEACASALPVVASRHGALATLVDEGRTGLLFTPGDACDLARTLHWALTHVDAMRAMGHAARAHYERHLTPAANHAQLMAIYAEAIGEARA